MTRTTNVLLAIFVAFPICAVSAAEPVEQNIEEQVSGAIKTLTADNVMWQGPKGRRKAIEFVAKNPQVSADPLLDVLVKNPSARVRLWILLCMNSSQDMSVFESGAPKIIKLLSDESFGTKYWAIKTVAKMKLAAAVGPLTEMLSVEDYLIRAATATALGQIGNAAPTEQLVELLKDAQPMVRRAAAEALGELKAGVAAPMLKKVLVDDNLVVQMAAVGALEKITGKSFDIRPRDWASGADDIKEKIKLWLDQNK